MAGVSGDIALEDAVDIAAWMVQTKRIPPFSEWSPEAAADGANAANEGLF